MPSDASHGCFSVFKTSDTLVPFVVGTRGFVSFAVTEMRCSGVVPTSVCSVGYKNLALTSLLIIVI
jgi:hypothetical protein